MKRHLGTILLAAGLALAGVPALAQFEGLGQTDANGCQVFVGTGSGQIVSDWGVYPIVDVGKIHVTNQVTERRYTFVFEGMSFPSVPVADGGVVEHRGISNWSFLEGGTKGTSRYRMVLTPDDPANPTRIDFVLDSEVIQGNRYDTGGGHVVASMDYWTGAYTISQFQMVLCQP